MSWSVLWFGKHKGKTLPQIMFIDPDWFFWACEEEDVFKDKSASLREEAEEIKRKSVCVKIPQNSSGQFSVEYTFYKNGFAGLEIVLKGGQGHGGSSITYHRPVIDFSAPRVPLPGTKCAYDKLGYRIFLKNVKFILFGDRSRRMTRRRCEEFFENDENFSNP